MVEPRSDLKELVRHHYAEWSAGNIDGVARCYAERCMFEDVTLETKAEGRSAVRDLVAAVCEAIPDLKWKLGLMTVEGDVCCCELSFEGMLVKDLPGIPATHQRVNVRELVVVIFRNGKIREYRGYWSMGMMLRQLGHVISRGEA